MQKFSDTSVKSSLLKGVMQLYYVAGNDAFLVDRCVSSIAQAALGQGGDSVLHFDQKSLCDGGFEELFYNFSILGQNRVAVIDDFNANTLTAAQRKLFEELFTDIPGDLTVILRQFSDDKRFAISKKATEIVALCKDGAVVSVTAKSGIELERYIEHIAKREGCEIEIPALRAIAALCGDDLLLVSNEIKKVAALSNYATITAAHVEALGIRTAEAGVYQMLSAIESGDTKKAASVLKDMLDDLNEPLAITSILNTAFINLYRARVAREKGRPKSYLYEAFDYKKGDRKVSIAYERSNGYSRKKLEYIIKLLYELDLKLKSSAVDARYIVEQKIIELSAVVAS